MQRKVGFLRRLPLQIQWELRGWPTTDKLLWPWEKAGKQLQIRKACQMTSNFRLFVNTTCTKLNECCKANPRVNTFLYTERSYKGVDSSDGLTFQICSQMGEDHTRPMGLTGNNRVPTGIYPDSIPNGAELKNKVFCRTTCQDNTEGLGPSDKGCCSKSGYGYRQLCLPYLPCEEKGAQ